VEFAADSAGAELCSGHSGDDSDRAGIEIDMPFGVYGELVLVLEQQQGRRGQTGNEISDA